MFSSAAAAPSPRSRRLSLAERRRLPPGPITCPDCHQCLSHTCAGGTRCSATGRTHITARYCRGMEKTGLDEADLVRMEATLFDEPGGFSPEEMAAMLPKFHQALEELEQEDLATAAKRGVRTLLQTIALEAGEAEKGEGAGGAGEAMPECRCDCVNCVTGNCHQCYYGTPHPGAGPPEALTAAPPDAPSDALGDAPPATAGVAKQLDYTYLEVPASTDYLERAIPQARRIYVEAFGERLLLGTLTDEGHNGFTAAIRHALQRIPDAAPPAPFVIVDTRDERYGRLLLFWSPTPDDRGFYLLVERPAEERAQEPDNDARRLSAAFALRKYLPSFILAQP